MFSTGHCAAVIGVSMTLILGSPPLFSDDQPKAASTAPSTGNPAPAGDPVVEKYKLAFKFPPNQILRYEVVHESETTTTAKEETESNRNSTTTKRHQRVLTVDEKSGTADLELSIDWVSMRATWPRKDGRTPVPVEFQSDDPSKQPSQFKHILATVGKPWTTIRFRTTGSPIKILAAAVKPNASKSATVSETGEDGALEAHLIVLPEHPVAMGDSWKEQFSVVTFDANRNLTKVTFQRTYKLIGVKDGHATIDLKTAILTPGLPPAISAQMLLREVAGKIVFDLNRGLIVSREWSVENTVVNALGANSLMKGWSRYIEKLVAEEPGPDRTAQDGAKPPVRK